MITKYIHAPWNYQINLLVSLWFLFCFVFICDESVTSSFNQKYRKSFYSYDKNKLFSYDMIRGIKQATNHSFFFFFGNQRGNQKKTHFALFSSRSKHRFSCSLADPTTTSKQQRNWENLSTKVKNSTPESRWLRFLDHVWKGTSSTTRLIKNLSRQWFNDSHISKIKKIKSRTFMSLCYTPD